LLETTAFGAGALAGLATGFWSSTEEIAQVNQVDRRFEPSMPASQRDRLRAGWREAVRRTRSAPHP
jgi:glycerol kinase